jgi:hypothetical protein
MLASALGIYGSQSDPLAASSRHTVVWCNAKRWAAEIAGLKAYFEAQSHVTDARLARGQLVNAVFGLLVFSDSNDPSRGSGPYPTAADVGIAPVAAGALSNYWGRVNGSAGGASPLRAALAGAYGMLDSYVPQADVATGGKRIVVAIADNVSDDYPTGSVATLARTRANQVNPVYTYPVAFSSQGAYDTLFFNQLAVAGQSAPPGCNSTLTVAPDCFIETSAAGDIPKQLESAVATAASCDVEANFVGPDGLAATVGGTQVFLVDSAANETPIAHDRATGWSFDTAAVPKRVFLGGAACALARRTDGGKMKIKITSCK